MSERTLDRLCDNIARIGEEFRVPLLLENPPQYLDMPGSTMTLPTFVRRMCERTDVSLLIDVTHLYIAASNAGWDPYEALDQWPMERVVEVHISGACYASGLWWDNHATAAPEDVMALFAEVMRRTRPRAVTLEYNWVPHIPGSFLLEQIARVREVIGGRP